MAGRAEGCIEEKQICRGLLIVQEGEEETWSAILYKTSQDKSRLPKVFDTVRGGNC